jgi:hypothetical protein
MEIIKIKKNGFYNFNPYDPQGAIPEHFQDDQRRQVHPPNKFRLTQKKEGPRDTPRELHTQ